MTGTPIRGVDHIGLVVRDTDAVVARFAELLGLTPVHDEVLEHLGLRLTYLATGNVEIQLVSPLREEGFIHEHLEEHGEGLHHVCLEVDRLETALDDISDGNPEPFLGGKGHRVCFLPSRPGGALIELIESGS